MLNEQIQRHPLEAQVCNQRHSYMIMHAFSTHKLPEKINWLWRVLPQQIKQFIIDINCDIATRTPAACIWMLSMSLTYINNSKRPRALPWGVAAPKTGSQLSSCPHHIMTFKLFSEYDHFDNSVVNGFNSIPIWDCFLFAASVRAFSKHLALYLTGT